MTEAEIKQTLVLRLKTIAPDTEPGQLQPNDNIRQTLGIDSYDYLQFIVALDEEFGLQTPEEDYGKIQTMKELVRYIQGHAKAKT
ncbi:phosphopantetheine-binding protein [Rufibacter radiotolerans]|uniref:Phosphopantetheine-binding protein n=1 Tax=Rufibacter radiotolerans TaxID=1379910 RepID=A0A0H4VPZ2_9BACT|nr:phosphopantetheine-binding protein [Rufibacter radiotolerans]AKQ45799.1 phosphopantetheine-binding protein [Rufibacter radiotolerans]